jgi:hypothetical protein
MNTRSTVAAVFLALLFVSPSFGRILDAELGRWLTRDPLGYVDGMGLYEYVADRPVIASDPSGAILLCDYMCSSWAAGTSSWGDGRHTYGPCYSGVGNCCHCSFVPCTSFSRTCPLLMPWCSTSQVSCFYNTPSVTYSCDIDVPVTTSPGGTNCDQICHGHIGDGTTSDPNVVCGVPVGPTKPSGPNQRPPIIPLPSLQIGAACATGKCGTGGIGTP